MTKQPAVFVSHGAPSMALEPGLAGAALRQLGNRLARPSSILIISPHWDTEAPMVSAAVVPDTIHDFYGFPDPLYEIRYPAPGAPELACRTTSLLEDAGIRTAVHPTADSTTARGCPCAECTRPQMSR